MSTSYSCRFFSILTGFLLLHMLIQERSIQDQFQIPLGNINLDTVDPPAYGACKTLSMHALPSPDGHKLRRPPYVDVLSSRLQPGSSEHPPRATAATSSVQIRPVITSRGGGPADPCRCRPAASAAPAPPASAGRIARGSHVPPRAKRGGGSVGHASLVQLRRSLPQWPECLARVLLARQMVSERVKGEEEGERRERERGLALAPHRLLRTAAAAPWPWPRVSSSHGSRVSAPRDALGAG